VKYAYELPVQPFPVTFQVSVKDVDYGFRTQYRETDEGGWLLDLFDANNLPLAMGIPLVVGLDLLYQYNHLAIGFALLVSCLEGRTTPTYQSLGPQDRLLLIVEV